MINVWIPTQIHFFDFYAECKKLYESVQNEICDTNSFDFIVNNTLFYLFEFDDNLIGAIYYFMDENGKLFFNAFANRKMHDLCIKCLKMSLTWFKGRVYAQAQNRASALCLLRCGFSRLENNVFEKLC